MGNSIVSYFTFFEVSTYAMTITWILVVELWQEKLGIMLIFNFPVILELRNSNEYHSWDEFNKVSHVTIL